MAVLSSRNTRSIRMGLKHGEAVQIGDITVRLSLDAQSGKGRRATLVISNPSGQPLSFVSRNLEPPQSS